VEDITQVVSIRLDRIYDWM